MENARCRSFGHMPDGTQVEELTLGGGDCCCKLITYGGAVRSLTVPGRDGPVDVALGYDTLEEYRTRKGYLGALIGRYANRIGGAAFRLEGTAYPLAANEGVNHLHGGTAGFDKQVWTVEELTEDSALLSLFSPHGQEGYPGDLRVQVRYTLSGGALTLDYWAQADGTTLCNLTNHTYFNLSGHGSGPVAGQYIRIFGDRYTPTDAGLIPTGELAAVEGTPMDLRRPKPIGARQDEDFPQLQMAGGYDHNWVIAGWDGTLRTAAAAWSPDTGILMEVQTTLPGIQFYGGNGMEDRIPGKGGAVYNRRCGFCLETQFFPDSPNHPAFPSAALAAGQTYRSTTVYRFRLAQGPEPQKGA